MLSLRNTDHIYLYSKFTDMRKGFNGLSNIVISLMELDVTNGDIFVFINRSKDKLKLLRFEKGGFSLYYKRLEKGRFELPKGFDKQKNISLSSTEIMMIIEGVSLEKRGQKVRF
ncbi:IS66 family insertion sequence element accessory protein TnpB [Flammeovirga sp. MY04]|uniref:IS66 family insertion sequence element accessory protein TnpB n=1 Tax=Flammeovirga sp. MY04 TaxID=1191459 RepID=UPI000825D036|nr:IS66 family insertion sequence element accessory protein TnpB [Flammeovirga sp. MY04]ANQ48585.2 IS66 family insertion sequence element accessory protein TnpB [Flammeovirga sp. MY04]ANQ51764.2 IS66 family insertion sequence element accessory protein TnpB [Flammeovirga sp. MY04]